MPIDFRPLSRQQPVRIYRRDLPHWRQDGATYFVTTRLHDSLPQDAVRYLEALRNSLIRAGDSEVGSIQADRIYFSKLTHYLEQGHGACWLRDPGVQDSVASAIGHFDGLRYQVGELAVLPNHLHVLVRPLPGCELEQILHSWKSFTAKAINRHVGRSGPVWQHESYDRLVRDESEFQRTVRYITNNRLPPAQRVH